MNHVMVDLETFGVRPGSVIRSIGAVLFDLDGRTGSSFYVNVEHASCVAAGLTVDENTAKWWAQQSPAAQAALLADPKPLTQAISAFHKWFIETRAEKIWSHGASFDVPVLEAAAYAVKLRHPWKFWNIRDTRTVHDICDFDLRTMNRSGVHHDALDDARFQISCIAAALRKLRGPVQKLSLSSFDEVAFKGDLWE